MNDSKINDGGPAFPIPPLQGVHAGEVGMSLRDYFAGKFLEGYTGSPDFEYQPDAGREEK